MAQITPQQFRQNFPEFNNVSQYPDAQVQMWLTFSYSRLNTGAPGAAPPFSNPSSPWGNLLDMGAMLLTAHNIVMGRQNQSTAARRGAPGVATGPINSKSVDKVSVGYDTTIASLKDAGHYNLTTYGTRYKELERIAGAGAVQVGACGGSLGFGVGFGPGWGYYP